MVSTRVYKNQTELLMSSYIQNYTEDGLLTLEMFVPIARLLLLMIYQNTYLGEVHYHMHHSSIYLSSYLRKSMYVCQVHHYTITL